MEARLAVRSDALKAERVQGASRSLGEVGRCFCSSIACATIRPRWSRYSLASEIERNV